MTEKNELWKVLLNDAVDYEQTVGAMLAFAALIIHDGDSRRASAEFGFGRRMTTSSENPIRPNSEVTPDLIAQKSTSYGIIAEAKKSLSREESQWIPHLERLLKYDDNLIGWWTTQETISHSDTIMLIHQSRGRQFVHFLERQKTKDPSLVGPTTSVVEFNQSEETVNYFFFRLEHGKIRDSELAKALDAGIQIPLDKVIQSFPNVRFYDSPPPVVLLLTQLWIDYFPSMLADASYDEQTRSRQIRVSVSATTKELQSAYGSGALYRDRRSVEFPRKAWIREAFERLVKHKLAVPPSDSSDNYVIIYRSFRGDVRERFARLETAIPVEKSEEKGQMPLFPQENKT